jgi:hypothetical protein
MKQVYSIEELEQCIGLKCELKRTPSFSREEYYQPCTINRDDDIKRYNEPGWWVVIKIPQYDKIRNTPLGRLLFL